jgi:hypothetical protein
MVVADWYCRGKHCDYRRSAEAVANGVFKQKAGRKVNSRFAADADHGGLPPVRRPYALRPAGFFDIGGNHF